MSVRIFYFSESSLSISKILESFIINFLSKFSKEKQMRCNEQKSTIGYYFCYVEVSFTNAILLVFCHLLSHISHSILQFKFINEPTQK